MFSPLVMHTQNSQSDVAASSLHNRGRKCAQCTRKWNSPAHRGVGWCGCDWLCKSIGHGRSDPCCVMGVYFKDYRASCPRLDVSPLHDLVNLHTAWPRKIPLAAPRTPLHILVLILYRLLSWQEVTSTVQTKNMSQDGLSRMSRTGVCTGGCLAPALHSDAHWRMQESATQARHTDVLEAEWVSCWLSALIPPRSFMQVQLRCHTLPLSEAGDAAHSRGYKAHCVN